MSVDTETRLLRSAVGRAIRNERVKSGMSMRALAERCGVSQPFISTVERGLSTPSIATLYRIAEELGTSPASLLPVHGVDDVTVIRADEGRRVPSSDHPDSAVGRVMFTDESRGLEVYEYAASNLDHLDVWFQHPGHTIVYVLEGHVRVEFEMGSAEYLRPGDCIVHPGEISHRWVVENDEPMRILVVVVRPTD